ncbi:MULTISPECIES: PPC domain-containing DNA-binding protein [unclassified Sinorhizobium]|uniref:PPC domain-containing DNA-binding protein n=1 Tax=unclassified Sinorhizobium TaxID=2613772 RepID=UPI003523C007
MKKKLLSKDNGERTFILVLEDGEEAFDAISRFAATEQIGGASLNAIGAFSNAVVGFFDFETKTYRKIPILEQCEVLSGIGDIAIGDDGQPSLHLHAVLGLSDGSTRGGHFMEGTVHPTLEVVVREAATNMCRRKKSDLGIALLDP